MNGLLQRGIFRAALAVTMLAHALLAVWVARDARRAGRAAGAWPLATLVGGVVALLAYKRTSA